VNATAYVLDAVRTPFGRYGGGLSGVRPDDLAAHVVRTLLNRSPALDPATVDDVLMGNANGAGEENRNVARMAALLAGLPTSVPGATVNRLCGSSLEAAIEGSRAIETGDASLIVAAGVESMSRAPWVLPKPDRAFPRVNETLSSTTLGWRLVNPQMPEQWTISLGESAEKLAELYHVSREDQDAFAVRSHRNAAAAWDAGRYDWVVPVPDTTLERDEGIRPDTSVEKLAKLKPAFSVSGTVTAGNASPLNDGAAAVLLGDDRAAEALGRAPLARVVSRGVSGVDPDVFGIAPVAAVNQALERAQIGWDDVAVVELNEAFASQSLADIRQWDGLDPEKVNPNGGAIALGHPLGASGIRLMTTMINHLEQTGGRFGLQSMCEAGGMANATIVEVLS